MSDFEQWMFALSAYIFCRFVKSLFYVWKRVREENESFPEITNGFVFQSLNNNIYWTLCSRFPEKFAKFHCTSIMENIYQVLSENQQFFLLNLSEVELIFFWNSVKKWSAVCQNFSICVHGNNHGRYIFMRKHEKFI